MSSDYFDIRTSSLYVRLGGMKTFLAIAARYGVQVHGTLILAEDLPIFLSYHNRNNPDNQLTATAAGISWVQGKGTVLAQETLPEQSLEQSILDALCISEQEQPAPAEEAAAQTPSPAATIDDALTPEAITPVLVDMAKDNLAEQYIAHVSEPAAGKDHIQRTSAILSELLNAKQKYVVSIDLESILKSTIEYVHSAKTEELLDVISKTFTFVSRYPADAVSMDSIRLLEKLQGRIGNISGDNGGGLELARKRAEANRKAFYTFKRFKAGNTVTRTRASAYHYLTKMLYIFKNTTSSAEKADVIDQAMDFCEVYSRDDVTKDNVGNANLNYFRAFFSFARFERSRDAGDLTQAEQYLKQSCRYRTNIRNSGISSELKSRQDSLKDTINRYASNPGK
ncbi:hypothetical protein KY363_00060 [Candidatus Woesearchaeota archaeon]|nr:hypothetical protein [Candidatus Woesearchaeota archaeon]